MWAAPAPDCVRDHFFCGCSVYGAKPISFVRKCSVIFRKFASCFFSQREQNLQRKPVILGVQRHGAAVLGRGVADAL